MKVIIRRWNRQTHAYEPVNVPDKWKLGLYSEDMDEIVNCPHCGSELPFGESYTSMEFHTSGGFGYAVCERCYREEWARRRAAEDDG